MLFYFRPAFYCDANDAWRLPTRRARFAVAAAGIKANLGCAVLLAVTLIAWMRTDSDVTLLKQVVLELALINVITAVMNLIPFVKLDGYWMLATAMGRPNLRAEAVQQAAECWALIRRQRTSAEQRLHLPTVLFGAVSATFGALMFVSGLTALCLWLTSKGTLGSVVAVGLAAVIIGNSAWAWRRRRSSAAAVVTG